MQVQKSSTLATDTVITVSNADESLTSPFTLETAIPSKPLKRTTRVKQSRISEIFQPDDKQSVADVDFPKLLQNKLRNPLTLEKFHSYLENVEHSEENLDFWLAVQKFKSLHSKANGHFLDGNKSTDTQATSKNGYSAVPLEESLLRTSPTASIDHRLSVSVSTDLSGAAVAVKECIHDIVSTYITSGSPREINISSQVRHQILTDAVSMSPAHDLFRTAEIHIADLMKLDSLPRFVKHATVNIGAHEKQFRLFLSIIIALVNVAVKLCLVFTPSLPQWTNFPIMFPFTSYFCFAYLQYAGNLCAIYYAMRRANLTGFKLHRPLDTEVVEEACVLFRQRALVIRILVLSFIFGAVLALICVAIPSVEGYLWAGN